MIGIKNVISCVMVAFLVMGCANATDYEDYAQSIDASNSSSQSAMVAYFNKKSIDNQNVFKALSGGNNPTQVQNNQMAIVLYTILSQQNDEAVLKQFAPKYAVKPTTNGDIGMSAMNNFLPTLVKWGAGAWLGSKIVDGLQTTSTVLGAGASMTTQNAGGDINGGVEVNTDVNAMEVKDSYNASGSGDVTNPDTQQEGCCGETVIDDTTEWTDTPGCSVASRAAGRC